MKKYILFFLLAVATVACLGFLPSHAAVNNNGSSGSVGTNYYYFNTATTSVIKGSSGFLGNLTIDTPATGTILTLYDDASTTVNAVSLAVGTMTVGGGSASTTNATGSVVAIVNGFGVTSVSLANGSTSVEAASALATAINASTSILGVVATSNSNVVNVTSTITGQNGNISLNASSPQNSLTFTAAVTKVTPIIAQITLPATLLNQGPYTATYNVQFYSGLMIKEATNTSAVTVTWQ